VPSTISEYDKGNIGAILGGMGDWFSARLLRLLQSCDYDNFETLRTVYPDHVEALEAWRQRGEDIDGEVT
jgi:hypothetical protein